LELSKKASAKRQRNSKLYAKLRKHSHKVRMDKRKNDVYASGIGFNSPSTPDSKLPLETELPETFCCRSCGRTDHRISDSELRPNYSGAANKEQLAKDASAQSIMDTFYLEASEANKAAIKDIVNAELEEEEEEEDNQLEPSL
jgi:hypothetical protein